MAGGLILKTCFDSVSKVCVICTKANLTTRHVKEIIFKTGSLLAKSVAPRGLERAFLACGESDANRCKGFYL